MIVELGLEQPSWAKSDCFLAEEQVRKELEDGLEKDALYLESFARIEGIGRQTLAQLLQKAGSPQALWEADDSFLQDYLTEKKRQAFLKARDSGLQEQVLSRIRELGVQLLACTHPLYPKLLKEIHNAPAFLYVRGNLSALTGQTVGVVGTRKASEYGRQVTEKLVGELSASQTTIVSGLAAGIDTAAHWAALKHHLPTVAVFGCGVDVIFPSSNRKLSEAILAEGGVLISEYPLGMPPTQYTFPQRNRIVAGLSQGLLVVEGDLKSGALITARLALEENRTVFAVPGNIFNPGHQGPFSLIQSGAIPVANGEDILREMNWGKKEVMERKATLDFERSKSAVQKVESLFPVPDDLSSQERLVLQAISHDPVSVDELQQTTGLPSAKINGSLTLLELEGLIVLLSGAKVCRKSIC